MVQFIYIALAESRGVEMVMLAIVAIVAFAACRKILRLENTAKSFLASVLVACVLIFAVAFLIWFVTKIFECLWILEGQFVTELETFPGVFHSRSVGKRADYINNNDFSNLRFGIWLSAFEIFKKNWLFGVTHGNILKYASDVFPDGFIARRRYDRAHSVWIGIPLYTGICGASCMFGFFLQSFWEMVSYYKNNCEHLHPVVILSSLVAVSVWLYGLVESEILFLNSVCSFLFGYFWVLR